MTIVIVRHGETALNATRVVQPPDTPLSPNGLLQAERLAARLSGAPIVDILVSDMPRARQTAAAIERRSGVPSRANPLLRERNFGTLCGTPYVDLPPNAFAPDFVPERGESWEAFCGRAADAWRLVRRAAAAREGTLVVVSHGLMCHAWAAHHLDLPSNTFVPAKFHNTSVTICEPLPPHRVHLLNCVRHLSDMPPNPGGAPV